MYFDLEFNKKVNPEKNGVEMVEILISVIFESLDEKYSIQGNYDWIIELDSSTEGIFFTLVFPIHRAWFIYHVFYLISFCI